MTVLEHLHLPSLGGSTEWLATDGTAHAKKVSGRRRHRIVKGVGHNLPPEAPHGFADAVVEVDGYRPACARVGRTTQTASSSPSRLGEGTDGPGCNRTGDVHHQSQPTLPRYDAPGGGSVTR